MNPKTASADERLRAATAAASERERLIRTSASLADDVNREQARVQQLAIELRREQQDVERLSTGVVGFLGQVFGTEELSREQREAFEAEARLREAVAARDMLRAQAANVASRLAVLTPTAVAGELDAAQQAKELALRDEGAPAAADLQEVAVLLESIDIELVPLEDAVASGNAALAVLSELAAALDRARADFVADKRKQVDTRGLAGDAQARLIVFHRALGELAVPDDGFAQPVTGEPSDAAFADPWIRALFGKGDPSARLAAARASIGDRLARVHAQLGPVRARYDELAARRAALVRERSRLLLPVT